MPDGSIDKREGPPPSVVLARILAVLAEPFTISEQAYAQRLRLLTPDVLAALSELELPFECLRDAGEIYMHCTYLESPDRHEIKRVVNGWLRKFALRSIDVPECTRKPERKPRPKVLIPLEWFGTDHSMFRCYAPAISQLKERFETIGMYGGDASDPQAEQVFERVIHLPGEQLEFSTIAEIIHAEAPDVIFFPSVGMASWCVALANIRLAPIQAMCPGHPASSLSECMDYFLVEAPLVGDRARYSERIIALPTGSARFSKRTDGQFSHDITRLDGRHVAVPAIAAKLIPPFMRALQVIKASCPDVTYHFFPNQTGLDHASVDYEIRKWFPDAVVYPRTDYQTYLDRLGACSLALDTFPFNGTNSVLDCFMCRVPVITLEGKDASERCAAAMIRRLGMDENCIAHTPEQFIDDAVAMIKRPSWLPEMPSPEQIDAEFFGPGDGHAFADSFAQMMEDACK